MMEYGYVLVWIVLVAMPAVSLWNKRWLPSALYLLGIVIFLYGVLRRKDGWDDLADIATLIAVVIPIYLIATLLWVVNVIMERNKNKA